MYLVRAPYLIKKLFPKAIWRMDSTSKKIYLTFDDGPVPTVTPWVLDLLKKENIHATFFCVGENVQKHTEIYQRILNENHRVGNHTFNHLKGWDTHTKDYIQNIDLCANVFKKCNQTPFHLEKAGTKSLFRPPYGRLKKSQSKIINSKFSIIMWDILSGDYDKKTSPEKCLRNVTETVRNGSIIVFHDSEKAKIKLEYALPRFIEYAKQNGFEFCVL